MLPVFGNKLLIDRGKMIRRFNPTRRLYRLSKLSYSKHGKSICPVISDNPRRLSELELANIKHALVDFVLRVSGIDDDTRERHTSEVAVLPAVLETLLDNFT